MNRKKFRTKPLPNTLWEMMLLALDDVIKVHNDPRYTLMMSTWHSPGDPSNPNATCYVCMGGAVMAGLKPKEYRSHMAPEAFLGPNSNKIRAMDDVRTSMWADAIAVFYRDRPARCSEIFQKHQRLISNLPDFNFSGSFGDQILATFEKKIRAVARRLKRAGI